MYFQINAVDNTFKEGDPARQLTVVYKGFNNKAEVRVKAISDFQDQKIVIKSIQQISLDEYTKIQPETHNAWVDVAIYLITAIGVLALGVIFYKLK